MTQEEKVAEFIFPEPNESRDERIRKGIKSILEHYKESGEVVCPYPFVSIDEALAWLDKAKVDVDLGDSKEDKSEIDEKYKIGKWFTGLIPCWVDAPSTLQAAHNHHGKNIVAIHLKDGGYRCCCVDDKEPSTFSLAEGTPLVEGWHNRNYRKQEHYG